jgi:hypothetical protein
VNREIPFDFIFDYLLPIETTTKPFFGMFAVRHGQRLLLLLRQRDNEPDMNGIWVATTPDGLDSLQEEFPALLCKFSPRKGARRKDSASWLLIPPDAADFERTAISICDLIVHRDPRIGRIPKPRTPRTPKTGNPRKTR